MSTRDNHVRHPHGSAGGYSGDINDQSRRLINAVHPGKDEVRGNAASDGRHWLGRSQGDSRALKWLFYQVMQPLLGAVKKVGNFCWAEGIPAFPPALYLVEGNLVHLVGNILCDSVDQLVFCIRLLGYLVVYLLDCGKVPGLICWDGCDSQLNDQPPGGSSIRLTALVCRFETVAAELDDYNGAIGLFAAAGFVSL
jgi:hypothetical protein